MERSGFIDFSEPHESHFLLDVVDASLANQRLGQYVSLNTKVTKSALGPLWPQGLQEGLIFDYREPVGRPRESDVPVRHGPCCCSSVECGAAA